MGPKGSKKEVKKLKKNLIFLKANIIGKSYLFIAIQIVFLHSFFEKTIKMYAIVDISGKQFKVEKDKFLYAPLQDAKEGSKVDFDQVLLLDNEGKVKVGAPTVKGAKVSGKVLSHVKDDKVIVFKKKRRKGYKVKNGHRQQFSKILIEEIKG